MSWCRGLVLLGLLALLAGCAGDYTRDDLRGGVEIGIGDPEELVDSAMLIAFEDLPDSRGLIDEIGRSSDGWAVVEPGPDGYDAVVVYRTGPCFGLVPAVSVFSEGSSIVIDVESRSRGDCPAKTYYEAIGIDFTSARDGRPIEVRHR